MKRVMIFGLIAVMLMALTSCAPGPNAFEKTENEEGEIAGFWQGLWNGIIAPVTFVISLFSDKINVYETHNNGGWYNFGFMIGLSIIFGGSGGGAARKRRRRD